MIDSVRDKILAGLRSHRGAQAEVVRRTENLKDGGFSRGYVFLVLSGERSNLEILNVAADVLAERENRKSKQINSLKEKLSLLETA